MMLIFKTPRFEWTVALALPCHSISTILLVLSCENHRKTPSGDVRDYGGGLVSSVCYMYKKTHLKPACGGLLVLAGHHAVLASLF